MNNDALYKRIMQKFEDGTFKEGKKCEFSVYYYEGKTIYDVPVEERTPGVCTGFMKYGKCQLSDVPESSRTRDFYIANFSNDEVTEYIKNHLEDFNREFFKDLIVTNGYATHFNNNCFEVMPLEYIDEEMCSLAIINSTNWNEDDWFYSAYKRKPEALSTDLWKLGARLYSRVSGGVNKFLNITPEEYKDEEYYKEMCNSQFDEGEIMDTIPQEIITPKFLIDLLQMNLSNIARFNEKALETKINPYVDYEILVDIMTNNIKDYDWIHLLEKKGFDIEKDRDQMKGKLCEVVFDILSSENIWQFVVRVKGDLIRNIPLNDERVEFFLKHYDKDSSEYKWGFKDKYKSYKKSKTNKEAAEQTENRANESARLAAEFTVNMALALAMGGDNPTDAIDVTNKIVKNKRTNLSFLPIKYKGIVPEELRKIYDTEEYLEMAYKELGIEILGEHDRLFYSVNLPDGWTKVDKGNSCYVKDENDNLVIEYLDAGPFYDRSVYVKTIKVSPEFIEFSSRNR